MAKTRPPYPPEFRRQMVELVRAGRSPEELAQEFEPTAQSIRNWVGQAECDAGRGGSGLTTAEREELTHWQRAADRTRTQVGRYVVVVAAQPCWRFAARNAATARLMTSLSYVLARARRSPARLSCILSVTVIEFSETGAAGLPARAGSR